MKLNLIARVLAVFLIMLLMLYGVLAVSPKFSQIPLAVIAYIWLSLVLLVEIRTVNNWRSEIQISGMEKIEHLYEKANFKNIFPVISFILGLVGLIIGILSFVELSQSLKLFIYAGFSIFLVFGVHFLERIFLLKSFIKEQKEPPLTQ